MSDQNQTSRPKYYQDWTKVLISRIQTSPTWVDLFEGISHVFSDLIYSNIYALSQIRNPEVQSRDINIHASKFLGFDYKSDLFSDQEYVVLLTFLNQFNRKYKGTKHFISFLGWVKQARFNMYHLWANGSGNSYGEFVRQSDYVLNNSKIDQTGTKQFFPTSHVELEFDAEKFEIDTQDIYELFYLVAPAHLVLSGVAGVFTADTAPLYLKTGVTDYVNNHIVAPCIYTYVAPLRVETLPPIQLSSHASSFDGVGYLNDNQIIYQQLPGFRYDTPVDQFNKYFTFTREGTATYYRRYSDYYSIAQSNEPRLCYVQSSNTPLGLRLEKSSTNLLINSGYPQQRYLTLLSGSYVFSGRGTYDIHVNQQLYQTVTDQTCEINLTGTSNVVITPISFPMLQPWFQLEKGTTSTSLIVTDRVNIQSRGYEYLQLANLFNPFNECTLVIKFNNVADNCCLCKTFTSQYSYIQLNKVGSKIVVNTVLNKVVLNTTEIDYQDTIVFGIKSGEVNVNYNYISFTNKNVPIPTSFYIGSDNNTDIINGYVSECYYYPIYISRSV